MTRLRILHAVRSDGFAGVERHVSTLAAAQSAAGHQVAVIGGDPCAMRGAILDPAVVLRPAATVREVAREINALGACDVLHVHMTAAEIAAVVVIRRWRVPAVSTRHFGGARGSSPGGRLAGPFVTARLAAQISISRYVAERVEGDSTVVHPGVASHTDGRTAQSRERTLLVVQRLEPEKSTDLAIRAFALSDLPRLGWTLQIAGAGSQQTALQALVDRLDVERSVRFIGHRSDVDTLMQRAGLLIAPCAVEGLGLTVLEAMAWGLPVVAAAAGGHLETVGSVPDPSLFQPHDAEAAGDMLSRLGADPAARDRYATELQQLQRTSFTVEAQVRATDAVYRRVL